MHDLGLVHVTATHQFRQQLQDAAARDRCGNQQFEPFVVVDRHRRDVKHAADPGPVTDIRKR